MTRALWTHLAKDLRIEWRSLDALVSMLFFSGLVVVLFSIAFDPRGAFSQQIAGGVLCGGHDVRLGERAEPGLGARDSPPGDGCAAHGTSSRRGAYIWPRCWPIFSLSPLFRSFLRHSFLFFITCILSGQAWLLALVLPLGTWALVLERHLLCRALHPQPKPRAAALADSLSYLHSRAAGDGAGDDRHPHRRKRSDAVDQAAAGLRHYFHDR